ncbi:hypothetical protein [Alicyclobacillus sp. SO9]|uniref:hypothetical protein n=1 Tax=Alicyclobacillus sp. SO9 TaxID=2665646 RepID=UPI0018E76005|nr:hypothetical protein [Alicyclobacillus sp. SO9]QQE78572.1 hypothetical protein GI364_22370 [Alicyclobacillus sp. SO9]
MEFGNGNVKSYGKAMVPGNAGLIEALHVDGAIGRQSRELMLFGQFVGSWDLQCSRTDANGTVAEMEGELHFGWVLGGRAVQDIWIVPGRGVPGEGIPPLAFHGSTLRFYDSTIDAWRSTWVEPVNGRVRRFIGKPVAGDIVLLSDEDEPQLRWSFTKVQAKSFTWVGEISHDGGSTWEVEELMHATRRTVNRAL